MPLSDKQLNRINEELLEIRDGLADMSEAVREQAREIRQAGRKIDGIFDRVADVKQFPDAVTREDFRGLLDSIRDLNRTANQLTRRGSE